MTRHFDFRGASQTCDRYLGGLQKLADELRKPTQNNNHDLAGGLVKLAANSTLPFVAPPPKAAVPFLNSALLQNATEAPKSAANGYQEALEALRRSDRRFDAAEFRAPS